MDRAVCTCPMRSYCKHVVALLITVTKQPGAPATLPATGAADLVPAGGAPAAVPWRTALSSILDEPPNGSATSTTGVRPLALAIGMTTPSSYSPSVSLTLRPMIQGAREKWIKTGASWRDIAHGYNASIDPAHQAAVRAIHRLLVGTTYMTSSDNIFLVSPPPALWRLLADAVTDGVTLTADTTLRGAKSVRLAAAALRYAITEHPDGARLRNELEVDGERVDPTTVEFIGVPHPHGVWHIADGVLTLAHLDHTVRRDEAEALQLGTEILIPAADLPEFTVDALPRLEQRRTVRVADGLLAPPVVEGPEAVLTITDADSGGRYYWSVGYRVNDRNVVFDPSQPVGATPYRDAAEEDSLWTEVRPLMQSLALHSAGWPQQVTIGLLTEIQRGPTDQISDAHARLRSAETSAQAVHEASWHALRQPITLTLPEVAVICGELLPELRQHRRIRVDYRCADEFRPAGEPPQIAFSSDDTPGNDWFGLAITVTVGDISEPIADLITELSSGATHMLLPDNRYFSLDLPELSTLADLLAEARSLGEIESGRVGSASTVSTPPSGRNSLLSAWWTSNSSSGASRWRGWPLPHHHGR